MVVFQLDFPALPNSPKLTDLILNSNVLPIIKLKITCGGLMVPRSSLVAEAVCSVIGGEVGGLPHNRFSTRLWG